MALRILISLFVFIFAGPVLAQKKDAIDEALALVGMQRDDLGWKPKGWWPRFPTAKYKLRSFASLFANPLDSIIYTRCLASVVKDKLDPARLDKNQGSGSRNLFLAVQRLGIDPKFGGFRGYTANLLAPQKPLDEALLQLIRAAGRPTRINTFGMELPYPQPRKTLAKMVKVLPPGVSPILGQLVLNLIDAHKWADLAFRRVDGNIRMKVAKRFNACVEMIDAYDYAPEMDDMALGIDQASLFYAGQKCVQALDDARVALAGLKLKEVPVFAFDWETPWGWIRIRGGGNDKVDGTNTLLIVDLGGEDTYTGSVATSTADRPIGLLLDMGGNDNYIADGPAQGAGICGIGILLDVNGNDIYKARHYAQGVGQFGLGLCADLAGNDHFTVNYTGQGCGYFGIGLLFDTAGDDTYNIYADGQGLGGVNGVGVLADHSGNDRYLAARKHTVTGRPSYHSPKLDVGVSNVQGCGMGRRGDGSDGHSQAGGLGGLFDAHGNDYYSAGNWSMGTGYWFGIGMLHDRNGNDEYHGVAYSQGTGAHFCIGVMIDEAGNDQHLAEENSTLSLAWAHDFSIGILLDVKGDDLYQVNNNGMAYSINRSVAMLLDTGGNDTYRTKDLSHPGFAKEDKRFAARSGVNTYFSMTSSIALFLDLGGQDLYWGKLKNDQTWLDKKGSTNLVNRNFSIGRDLPGGKINFSMR